MPGMGTLWWMGDERADTEEQVMDWATLERICTVCFKQSAINEEGLLTKKESEAQYIQWLSFFRVYFLFMFMTSRNHHLSLNWMWRLVSQNDLTKTKARHVNVYLPIALDSHHEPTFCFLCHFNCSPPPFCLPPSLSVTTPLSLLSSLPLLLPSLFHSTTLATPPRSVAGVPAALGPLPGRVKRSI
jgi:hypothetical protein